MTVILDQQQQSNMEVKLMRVLLAFSQSIEETIQINRNSINEIERKVGLPTSQTKIKELDRSQLDSTNHALYTASIVRNVINRSKEFSDEMKSISSNVKLSQQTKQQQINAEKELEIQKYKDEIESLKLKIQHLESNSSNGIVNNNSSNLDINGSNAVNTAPNSTNLPITNDFTTTSYSTTTTETKLGDSSSSIGSNISSSSSSAAVNTSGGGSGATPSAIASDWDTKFQTELQLNEMLSEFLKDDFELISTIEDNNNSSSPTPSTPTHTITPQNSSSASLSPILTHTSSSMSIDSPSKSVPKKAMLTDLLDQIDLESNNSPTSKSKKSKFKFF